MEAQRRSVNSSHHHHQQSSMLSDDEFLQLHFALFLMMRPHAASPASQVYPPSYQTYRSSCRGAHRRSRFFSVSFHRTTAFHSNDFYNLAIYCFIANEEEAAKKFVHSRNRKVFYQMLSIQERRKRDRRIPRLALHLPQDSAWRKLYSSNNDQALITLTGLDNQTFGWLLGMFSTVYDGYTPYSDSGRIIKLSRNKKQGGRPRLMTAGDCLGLYLAWTRLRGTTVTLQMIFGLSATTVSLYLRFARRILLQILSRHPDAAIRTPNADKIREYQAIISH